MFESTGRFASSLDELGLIPPPPNLAQRPIVQCTEVGICPLVEVPCAEACQATMYSDLCAACV